MEQIESNIEKFLPAFDPIKESVKKCDDYAMDLIRLKKSLEVQINKLEAYGKRLQFEHSQLGERNNRIIFRVLEILDEVEANPEKLDKFSDYIRIRLVDSLSREGITALEIKPGDLFDPELHKVLEHEWKSEYPASSVVREITKGYVQNRKIFRKSGISINDVEKVKL